MHWHGSRTAASPRSGFSLVEVMVVVAILATLLGIASRRHSVIIERSRDAALLNNLAHIRTAVHQSALDSGGLFPEDLGRIASYVKLPLETWSGSRAEGRFHYDAGTGLVRLYDRAGQAPERTLDSKGIPYGDY